MRYEKSVASHGNCVIIVTMEDEIIRIKYN